MTKSQFNAIVVLDAIPDGELNTARRLRENLKDISCYKSEGLQVRYFRLETYEDLNSAIRKIIDEVNTIGLKPWLHLEGHGIPDESGFLLASGTSCSWVKFKEIITELNVIMELNLILVLATCYGGSFARAINTIDRAPVLGLIGPTREVKAGEIEDSFLEFYRTFFETSSLREAIKALKSTAPKDLYYRTTADRFFYEVWAGYKRVYCTKESVKKRVRLMFRKAKSKNLPKPLSIGQLKRAIHGKEREFFEKYRDIYFMYDIYESNKKRFSVSYKEAEAYISR